MKGRIKTGPTKSPVKSRLKPKQLWILWPEVYSPSYAFNFWHTKSRAQEREARNFGIAVAVHPLSPVAQVLLVLIQTGESSSASPVHLKRQTSKILNSYRCWKKSNCSVSSSGLGFCFLVFVFQSLACRTKLMRMSDDYLKKKKAKSVW